MKCFYYKWINKKNGNIVLVNFGWAESFDAIKKIYNSKFIECIEIDKKEFEQLRNNS